MSSELPLTPSTGGRSIGIMALQEGDIIVTTSHGLVAKAIRAVTSGPVSHVMVFSGNGQIIESVREGVREISLNESLADASLAVAFRRTSITDSALDTVVTNVRAAIGESYNYWAIILHLLTVHSGLVREVPIPTNGFYCSQMVLTAYASAGFPLLKNGDVSAWPTKIVTANDFGESLLNYVGHLIAN